MFAKFEDRLLTLSALVLVAITAAIILSQWRSLQESGPLLLLLIGFGLLVARAPEAKGEREIHLYFILQSILVTLMLTRGDVFIFLFFILSAQAMMFLPTRGGVFWLGIFTLITLVANVYEAGDLWAQLLGAAVNAAGYFFFGAFGSALVRADQARSESNRLLAELQTAHDRLQQDAHQAEVLAVAEERNRLSRDLHDTLGHRLTASIVQLEGAERLLHRDPDRAAGMVGTVRGQLSQGLEDLRSTLRAIRSPQVTHSAFPRMLRELGEEFSMATGITVNLDVGSELPELSEAQRITLYRAAQEGLTNAQRHARANTIWLTLKNGRGSAQLTIRDNGQGIEEQPIEPGIGLRGMQERVRHLGGVLKIGEANEGGAQLSITLPLKGNVDDGKQ